MGEREFRMKLAKFRADLAIREAQLIANPLPALKEMESHCVELLRVLEDVKYALSPDLIFDVHEENSDRLHSPNDIQGEALIRCNKALKILNNYQ